VVLDIQVFNMKNDKLKGVEERIKFFTFDIETYPGFSDTKFIIDYDKILLENRLKKIEKIRKKL